MHSKTYIQAQKDKERFYRLLFSNGEGSPNEACKVVMADLRSYCNATKSNFSSDIAEMARMEGRREVFNRIMAFLKVDYEQYYDFEENVDYGS